MKKVISLIIVALLLVNTSAAFAFETHTLTEQDNVAPMRASLYLSSYSFTFKAIGNGQFNISYTVGGTRRMDKIGAYSFKVEQLVGSKWYDYFTYYGSDNDDFYSYNAADHSADFYFRGLPGVTYRVTFTSYAGLNGGYDTGTPLTSNGAVCK